MKKYLWLLWVVCGVAAQAWAAEGEVVDSGRLLRGLWSSLVYGVVGIALSILGFRLFDWVSPFNLEKEISEHKNVAVGIICGAMILGICIVVSVAIL